METWLTDTSAQLLSVPNYVHHSLCRQAKKGGGISILVHRDFSTSVVYSVCNEDVEILAVQLVICNSDLFIGSYSHLVVGIYRPPSQSQGSLKRCLDFLHLCLEQHAHSSNFVTVIGDFNRLDTLSIEAAFLLTPRVSFYTRGSAILDQVLSNARNYTEPQRLAPLGSSDHCVILLVPCGRPPKHVLKTVKVADKRLPFVQKSEYVLATSTQLGTLDTQQDFQTMVDSFYAVVSRSLECIPTRSVKIGNRDPKWKTGFIKDIERRREVAYKRGDSDKFQALSYKLKREVGKARRAHVRRLSTGSKAWWKEINHTLKPKDGNLGGFVKGYVSPLEAAQAYSSCLADKFPQSVELDKSIFPTITLDHLSEVPEISIHDIHMAIKHIRIGSAPGDDSVPPWYVKYFEKYLLLPLCTMFNKSLRTGYLPSQWKRAIVCPIPKVSNAREMNDLRPISLTSVFAKILEKVVLKKSHTFWLENIGPDQFAYKPNCSTDVALTVMQHSWLSELDRNRQTIIRVLAIDFSKAFDCVEQALLLGKLVSYGAPVWLTAWICSFFFQQ